MNQDSSEINESPFRYDHEYPVQGWMIGQRVEVRLNGTGPNTKSFKGVVIRDDLMNEGLTIFQLDDGRVFTGDECTPRCLGAVLPEHGSDAVSMAMKAMRVAIDFHPVNQSGKWGGSILESIKIFMESGDANDLGRAR